MSHVTNLPPEEALREFLAPVTRHVRRVEIYEQDAVTRWSKDTVIRLKSGSVSVDSSRDERRVLDNLVLDNSDGLLVNAPGDLWYDKIIKVFRGVHIQSANRLPKILVISDRTGLEATGESFRQAAVESGFGDVQVNTLVDTLEEIMPYDIIVGLGNASPTQITLLVTAYRSGKSVILMSEDAVQWVAQAFAAEMATAVAPNNVVPNSTLPLLAAQGWSEFPLISTTSTTVYTTTEDSWTAIAFSSLESTYARVATAVDPTQGGKAFIISADIVYQQYEQDEFINMIESGLRWLNPVEDLTYWETQVGEFMIDRITEPSFPHEVRITGRDYTKKCMKSKFTSATQFEAGYSLESLVASLASNAGIIKRQLPVTDIVVGRNFYFDRGVSRWEAMKEIANAYNYDIFFNAQGYLVMKLFSDPATDSPSIYIQTGKQGQIASYEKSTSDSRIYNHVVVTGESSDSDTVPVYATAVNDDPASPTNRDEIGDILYQYTSSFITTTAQAQDVADKFLAVHSLEEFELNFETLMLPWLDAGELIGFIDPNPAPGDPTVFLLTNLSIPLALGPMGGSARRVTNVG